jgi:hypothetical protein
MTWTTPRALRASSKSGGSQRLLEAVRPETREGQVNTAAINTLFHGALAATVSCSIRRSSRQSKNRPADDDVDRRQITRSCSAQSLTISPRDQLPPDVPRFHNGREGASPTGVCSHCNLALPHRPYLEEAEGRSLAFCCFGCLTVYRLVGSGGDSGRAGWFLAKLGLAAVLSGNVMMFQSLLSFGSLDTLGRDVLRTVSGMLWPLRRHHLLLGVPMLRVAYRALRQTGSC